MPIEPINFKYPRMGLQSVFDGEQMTALELSAVTSKKVDECIEVVNGVEQIAIEATAIVDEMKVSQEQFVTENNDARQQMILSQEEVEQQITTQNTTFINGLNTSKTSFETTMTNDLNTFKTGLNTQTDAFGVQMTEKINNFNTDSQSALTTFATEKTTAINNLKTVDLPQAVTTEVGAKITDGTIGALINTSLLGTINTNITEIQTDIEELMTRGGGLDVNVINYGAIGDGVTNDTTAFNNAHAFAKANNKALYIPKGYTFLIDQLFTEVSVYGEGTIKINPYDNFPYHTLALQGSDIIVDGITVDGNNAVIGIMGYQGDRHIIRNCTTKNCKLSGIRYCGDGAQVLNNHVYNVVKSGEFADGIYGEQTTNATIKGNTIHDIHGRIGIVCEGDVTGVKSRNVLIEDNLIYNIIDSGTQEYNAGIWVENTISGKVLHNTIISTKEIGININVTNQTTESGKVIVQGNTIKNTPLAIVVAELNCLLDVDVKDNEIINYRTGIMFNGAKNFTVENNTFTKPETWESTLSAIMTRLGKPKDAILYFDNGFTNYNYHAKTITVRNNSKGASYHDTTLSCDIYMTDTVAGSQGYLLLDNLNSKITTINDYWKVWSIANKTLFDKIIVNNCSIIAIYQQNCFSAKEIEINGGILKSLSTDKATKFNNTNNGSFSAKINGTMINGCFDFNLGLGNYGTVNMIDCNFESDVTFLLWSNGVIKLQRCYQYSAQASSLIQLSGDAPKQVILFNNDLFAILHTFQ